MAGRPRQIKYRGAEIDPETKKPFHVPNWDTDPVEARVWAKQEYMRGKFSVQSIAEWTGISNQYLQYWILKGDQKTGEPPWSDERNMIMRKAIESVVQQQTSRLQYCIGQLLFITEQTIQRFLEMNYEFSLKELQMVVGMLGKLQETYNLQIGEPTKIFGLKLDSSKSITWDDILERIRSKDVIRHGNSLNGVIPKTIEHLLDKNHVDRSEVSGIDPGVSDSGSAGGATPDTEDGS